MKKVDNIFFTYPYSQGRPQNIWVFLLLPLTVLYYNISNCVKSEIVSVYLTLIISNPAPGDKGLYPEVSGDSQKGYIGDWIHPEYSLTQACFSVLNSQDS